MPECPRLEGELHEVPLSGEAPHEIIATRYGELVAEHGVNDVLVLTRFPAGTETVTETLADTVDGVDRPEVVGLSTHATRVLEELDDPPRRLDAAERNLLRETFVAGHDWDEPYLERAADKQSFPQNVGRFVSEAAWHGAAIETDDPILAELASATEAFQEWLAGAGAIDPARRYRLAADVLAEDELRARVQEAFEAVLVLEFEEFTSIDREYLARLTEGCPLVCVAEADSAIQRTWNEPGRIADHTPAMTVFRAGRSNPDTLPEAIAGFLATGEKGTVPDAGSAAIIEAGTFRDQVAAVAAEISRLHRTEGVPYDEIAVVLRDANAPIADALRYLRSSGVEVVSATVSGLEHDPAARELYALVRWCVARDADDPQVGWSSERARTVLDARVEGLENETLEQIRAMCNNEGPMAALDRWLVTTDLKHRIADAEEPLTARSQFEHVETIRSLAGAIDRSPLLDDDWATLQAGIELEMRRSSTDKVATELTLPEGDVLVDAVRVAKSIEREAVFLLDVVDREYPSPPTFNAIFPTPHLEQLPAYPSFTTPDVDDVRDTYTPADGSGSRPLRTYYAALSRRLLAVGASAATDRLYFGIRREGAGTGQQLQPSRFLDAVEATFGELDRIDHDRVHTHGEAVRFALEGVNRAFEGIRRGGLVDDPVDLTNVKRDLATIQGLLAADPPEDLAGAIEARVDFAEGAVRRE